MSDRLPELYQRLHGLTQAYVEASRKTGDPISDNDPREMDELDRQIQEVRGLIRQEEKP